MNESLVSDAQPISKKFKAGLGRVARHDFVADGKGRLRGFVQSGSNLRGFAVGKIVVGVQSENPVFRNICDRSIARGAEIVAPGEAADAVREFAGDLAGVIGRSRVRDVDSVDNRGDAFKAASQVFSLIAGNDAKRERLAR